MKASSINAVHIDKPQKIRSVIILAILVILAIFLWSQKAPSNPEEFNPLVILPLLGLAFFKNAFQWLAPIISIQDNELKVRALFGFNKVRVSHVSRVRYACYESGWLNPKHGFFVIERGDQGRSILIAATSAANKADLEQFFTQHFPEQWHAADPMVAALKTKH